MDALRAMARGRTLRVIGFDDSPFSRDARHVGVSGIVCAGTRFEGMHWFEVERDGFDATATLIEVLQGSKFLAQVHAVLLDGIAFGGFNLIDLPALAQAVERPCIAVMRKMPDMEAIDSALGQLSEPDRRRATLARAGELHQREPFVFQVCGELGADDAARLLEQVTDTGHVPEALRLAHLIGSAVQRGTSSKRA